MLRNGGFSCVGPKATTVCQIPPAAQICGWCSSIQCNLPPAPHQTITWFASPSWRGVSCWAEWWQVRLTHSWLILRGKSCILMVIERFCCSRDWLTDTASYVSMATQRLGLSFWHAGAWEMPLATFLGEGKREARCRPGHRTMPAPPRLAAPGPKLAWPGPVL